MYVKKLHTIWQLPWIELLTDIEESFPTWSKTWNKVIMKKIVTLTKFEPFVDEIESWNYANKSRLFYSLIWRAGDIENQ